MARWQSDFLQLSTVHLFNKSKNKERHTSVNSAPGQVILNGISSVKEGCPPLLADTPLHTSSSPARITSRSPAFISRPAAELLRAAPATRLRSACMTTNYHKVRGSPVGHAAGFHYGIRMSIQHQYRKWTVYLPRRVPPVFFQLKQQQRHLVVV